MRRAIRLECRISSGEHCSMDLVHSAPAWSSRLGISARRKLLATRIFFPFRLFCLSTSLHAYLFLRMLYILRRDENYIRILNIRGDSRTGCDKRAKPEPSTAELLFGNPFMNIEGDRLLAYSRRISAAADVDRRVGSLIRVRDRCSSIPLCRRFGEMVTNTHSP